MIIELRHRRLRNCRYFVSGENRSSFDSRMRSNVRNEVGRRTATYRSGIPRTGQSDIGPKTAIVILVLCRRHPGSSTDYLFFARFFGEGAGSDFFLPRPNDLASAERVAA